MKSSVFWSWVGCFVIYFAVFCLRSSALKFYLVWLVVIPTISLTHSNSVHLKSPLNGQGSRFLCFLWTLKFVRGKIFVFKSALNESLQSFSLKMNHCNHFFSNESLQSSVSSNKINQWIFPRWELKTANQCPFPNPQIYLHHKTCQKFCSKFTVFSALQLQNEKLDDYGFSMLECWI